MPVAINCKIRFVLPPQLEEKSALFFYERTTNKLFRLLQVRDLENDPIWEFVIDDEANEVSVFPVGQLPVTNMTGRVAGVRVRLANEQQIWAEILHLDIKHAWKNQHPFTLRFERDGKWFTSARYWDLDYQRNGPRALVQFLDCSIEEIFLISYDLTAYVSGVRDTLVGSIPLEPRERLSEREIIRFAVL